MPHRIPENTIKKYTKGISDTKRSQVSNLQNHIQQILGSSHHTFLQGSYKNDTSTSDINDVDIVAVRLTTFSNVYSTVSTSGLIYWGDIFTEIEQKLKAQRLYQWTVVRKDKCIEVQTTDFKADVVPAVQVDPDHKIDPIVIYSFRTGLEKINYPRTHYENGVQKHNATNQNYKPLVRMFKNWATNHFGTSKIVTSYHIESLVHGAPNDLFHADPVASFILVGDHVVKLLSQRNLLPVVIRSVCGSEDITQNWEISARTHFKNTLSQSVSHGLNAYNATTIQDSEYYWSKAFND